MSHTLPPAIQVWADDDNMPKSPRRKSAEDEDLQLTPKAVVGPMFLMPDIAVPTAAAVENIEKAMENGATGYLQVPFAVPRRRHSWICG